MPSGLGGVTLTPAFTDNFNSGTPVGWSAVQGASLSPGHSGLGWDLSNGAGGTADPVIVYDWSDDSENVWGTSFWWQQHVGVGADFMRWDALSGSQVTSDVNADGSVQLRPSSSGPPFATSAAGAIANDTWQFHDIRFQRGPTEWGFWWKIDSTVVIDHGMIAGTWNPIFRVVWSTTGARSWLDDVTVSFVRAPTRWHLGRMGMA